MESPRRRHLLEVTATAIAAGAAGCLSSTGEETPTTDEGSDDATTEGTEATDSAEETSTETTDDSTDDSASATASVDGEFEYDAWLPAPDVVEVDEYWTYYGDLDAVRSGDVASAGLKRIYQLFVPLPGDVLASEEVTAFAAVGRATGVCAFDLPTSEVESRLADAAGAANGTQTASAGTDEDSDGTGSDGQGDAAASVPAPEGYVGYQTAAGLYWLGADHVVFGANEMVLQAIVDAKASAVDRYPSNDDFAAVRNATGDVDLGAGRAAPQSYVSGSTAFAYGWTFEDTVSLTAAFAFPDAASTDADAVDALGDQAGFAEYDQQTVSTDDRVVSLTGTIAPGDFDLLQRDDGGEQNTNTNQPPQISVSFEFDQGGDNTWNGDEDERVVLTHQGGDNVDLDTVEVHYDGVDVDAVSPLASTKPSDEQWTAGGRWMIRVVSDGQHFAPGAVVEVVWTGENDDQSAVLAVAEIP